MKLKVALIRAGMTRSGQKGRQVGSSDEPLLDKERKRLRGRMEDGVYPEVELAYVSALHRCRETAAVIYPRVPAIVVDNLRALDIGDFAGKTYHEIAQEEEFVEWAETAGVSACPNGEDPYRFSVRCTRTFHSIVEEMCSKGIESASVITHNLVIGTIMRRYCIPRSAYRDWDLQWGGGYVLEYDSLYSVAKLQMTL